MTNWKKVEKQFTHSMAAILSIVQSLCAKSTNHATGHRSLLLATVYRPTVFCTNRRKQQQKTYAAINNFEKGNLNLAWPTVCARFAWRFSYESFRRAVVVHVAILVPFVVCSRHSIWFRADFCVSQGHRNCEIEKNGRKTQVTHS